MKKFLGSAAFLSLFGLYSLYHYPDALAATNPSAGSSGNTAVTSNSTGSLASAQSSPPPTSFVSNDDDASPDDEHNESSVPQTNPTPQTTPTPAPTPAPKPKATGQYKDGTYTGSSVYAYYGNVQVRAIVSGGKIADVQFIQYPNDRNTSRYINSQAMPLLTQEAIRAQSANVSGVSGASDTSAGFRDSLASALSQARS